MSSKISALSSGSPAVTTDELPIARSGANYKLEAGDIAALTIPLIYDTAIQVDAATTAALAGSPTYSNGAAGVGATLTKGSNGAFPSQDGVVSALNNRYLIKNQVDQKQNGVYLLTTLGTAGTPWILTRATDSDTSSELNEQVVIPGGGTNNKRKIFSQTTVSPVIGTNNIVYGTPIVGNVTGIGTSNSGEIPVYSDSTGRKIQSSGVLLSSFPAPTIIFPDEVTAQAAIGTFVTPENGGGLYVIKNIGLIAQSIVAADYVGVAISTDELAPACSTLFQNTPMQIASVDPLPMNLNYDLVTGTITKAEHAVTGVCVYDSGSTAVANWLFTGNPANQKSILAYDPLIASFDAAMTILRTTFYPYSVLTLANGSSITDATIMQGAEVDIGSITACTISGGIYQSYSTVILVDNHTATNWTLGCGKTVDLTTIPAGYNPTNNPVYEGDMNTFICDVIFDLAGLTELNIASAIDGGDYSFCSRFTNITNSSTTALIDTVTSNLYDHKILLFHINLVKDISYNTGGNMLLSGGIILKAATDGDVVVLCPHLNISTTWTESGDSLIQH